MVRLLHCSRYGKVLQNQYSEQLYKTLPASLSPILKLHNLALSIIADDSQGEISSQELERLHREATERICILDVSSEGLFAAR